MLVRRIRFSGLLAALASAVSAQELPRLERVLAELASPGSPPLLAVVVAADRPAFVRTHGIGADGSAGVPLGSLSRLVVARAVGTVGRESGWDLDEPMGAGDGGTLADADAVVRAWTWRQVLDGEARGARGAFRFLAAGDVPRPPAEFVARHGMPGGVGVDGTHLPAAALQVALEQRTGEPFPVWLERASASLGMGGVAVGGSTVRLYDAADGGSRAVGEQPRAEVAAAFEVRATATDVEALLRWYLVAVEERAPGGSERRFVGRDQTARYYGNFRHGAACEAHVMLDGSVAWFVWSATRSGRERFAPIRDALLEDLCGPARDEAAGWNSAVGFGGGAGGRFAREPEALPQGSFRASIDHLGRSFELDLRFRGRVAELALDGVGRRGGLRVRGTAVDGEISLGGDATLEVDLEFDGIVVSGQVCVREPGRMLLPYRVRFERAADDGPETDAASDVPSLGRPFGVAMADASARLAARLDGVGTGRVVAVGTSSGETWSRAFGFANPDTGLPMRDESRVPLGTLTRELFDEAFAYLAATSRLDTNRSIEGLLGGREPPFDRRLLRLGPSQLASGGAPLPDYFRVSRDPDALRPLDDVLRAHAFFVARWEEPDPAAVLPRAVLLRALEAGGVIPDWRSFVAFELAGVLEMPGLVDAQDAVRDRRALRLRDASGTLHRAPLFEVPCDGGAWARGADVASWMTGLVRESLEWAEILPPEGWERRRDPRRRISAFVRVADLDDMTCRIFVVPDLELGVFVWGGDGERGWIAPAVESVVGAYWDAPGDAATDWTERRAPGPFAWLDEDESAPESRALAGAPCAFRGRVGELGNLEVRCTTEAGAVDVSLNGARLEALERRTTSRTMTVHCALPARFAPGGEAGARLVLHARVRSGGLRGEVAVEAAGVYRLPYALELAPLQDR